MPIRREENVFHASQGVVHVAQGCVTCVLKDGNLIKRVAVCQKTVIVAEPVCIKLLRVLSILSLFCSFYLIHFYLFQLNFLS